MIALNQACRRIRGNRGSSFLTHGADNYDHKGLNKARRQLGRALIEEALEPEPTIIKPNYKWVLHQYFYDDDKPHRSDWSIVGLFDTESEMTNYRLNLIEGTQVHWDYKDINEDWESQDFLEYQAWRKAN